MTNFIEIKTTFSDSKKGQDCLELIIKTILSQELSSCIQSSKIESYYIWPKNSQNINKEQEILVTIKAEKENYQQIEEIILQNHEYELPQIIFSRIDGGYEEYLQWLQQKAQSTEKTLKN